MATSIASSSSSLVAAASWSSTSDILRSIFPFLTFPEFMQSTISVSRTWYQQALRQPSYDVTWPIARMKFDTSYDRLVTLPSTSPFLSHLTKFCLTPEYFEESPQYCIDIQSVIELTQGHLKNLTSLTVATNFTIDSPEPEAMCFNTLPVILSLLTHVPLLRSLTLQINIDGELGYQREHDHRDEDGVAYTEEDLGFEWTYKDEDEIDPGIHPCDGFFTKRMIQLTSCIAKSCPLLESLTFGSLSHYESEFRITKPTIVVQHFGSLTQLHTLDLSQVVSLTKSMSPADFTLLHSGPKLTSLILPVSKSNV